MGCFDFKLFRFRARRNLIGDVSACHVARDMKNSTAEEARPIKEFRWEEVRKLTRNFSRVIEYGGFSAVYMGNLSDRKAAIKVYSGDTEFLARMYDQELQALLHASHPNIARILGWCKNPQTGGVLVFEFVAGGTLQERLRQETLLPWKSRVLIAFQLAEAIEHLHEKCGVQIIHGDIKGSNVLLDEQFNCKLCDFGSARIGFSSTVLPPSSTRANRLIMGSHGYTDPYYLKTGITSKKSDIYSYGVILLELITGKDAACLQTGGRPAEVAGKLLSDTGKASEMVDGRLKKIDEGFHLEKATAMAAIAATCVDPLPMRRPSASQILATLRERFDSLSLSLSPPDSRRKALFFFK